jgi:hypothetical protein
MPVEPPERQQVLLDDEAIEDDEALDLLADNRPSADLDETLASDFDAGPDADLGAVPDLHFTAMSDLDFGIGADEGDVGCEDAPRGASPDTEPSNAESAKSEISAELDLYVSVDAVPYLAIVVAGADLNEVGDLDGPDVGLIDDVEVEDRGLL